MNGIYRGGRFGWHGYTSRCGGTRFQNTHSNRESGIGFRLNGVRRSGYYSESKLWYSRCAGYRNGDYARTLGMETLGFRLNGDCRGGMYSTNVDAYNRCGGFRNRNRLSLVYVSLGFRVGV